MRLIKGRSFYKEPWYGNYRSMMDRCYRESAKNYPCYGDGLTIDRINVNGNYEPSNCQWLTRSENTKKAWEDRRNAK